MLEHLLSGVQLTHPLLQLTAQLLTLTSLSADCMTSQLTQHLTPSVSTLSTWYTTLNQAQLIYISLVSAMNLNHSTPMFERTITTNSSLRLYKVVKSFVPSLPPRNVLYCEWNWPTFNPNICLPAVTTTYSFSSSS